RICVRLQLQRIKSLSHFDFRDALQRCAPPAPETQGCSGCAPGVLRVRMILALKSVSWQDWARSGGCSMGALAGAAMSSTGPTADVAKGAPAGWTGCQGRRDRWQGPAIYRGNVAQRFSGAREAIATACAIRP